MLTFLDWVVIAAIVAFLILIIKKFAPKIKSAETYYMASRSIPYSLLVGTMVASWYGGPAFLGSIESAAVSGMASWGIWCVGAHAARIPLALWIAPAVSMRTEMTVPQMLKTAYGKKVSIFMAAFIVISLLSISEVVALKNIFTPLFGEASVWIIPLVVIGIAMMSIFGGLMGVAVTDMLLFFCMCSSLSIAASVLWGNVGGWDGLMTMLNSAYGAEQATDMLSPFKGANTLEVVTLLFLSVKVYFSANLYQRFSAAESPRAAARSYLTCFSIFVTLDFLLAVVGLTVGAMYPGTNIAQSFIRLVCELLPAGLRGVFFAGMLGAIISTLDSEWLVGSMMISNDLVGGLFKLDDRKKILVGKIAVLLLATICYCGAFLFTSSISVIKFFGTMIMSVQFVMAMMGIFYRGKKTAAAAWASMICGGITFYLINYHFPIVTPMGNLNGAFIALPVGFIAWWIGNYFGKDSRLISE